MSKTTIPLFLFSVILSMSAAGADKNIPTDYSHHNKATVFFVKPVNTVSSADYTEMYKTQWYYEETLVHKMHDKKKVSTCSELVESMNAGYHSPSNDEYDYLSAVKHICITWGEIAKLKVSKDTFLIPFQLDKSLASVLPPQLALMISDEDLHRAATMPSWDAMYAITHVIQQDDEQAIFETSSSTQKLTVMAKGDYNQDGVEDIVVYLEDAVKGGSYSAVRAFVLTKYEGAEMFTLLHQW